jgi:hypothetical protein
MASTPPDAVNSNISKWLKALGATDIPAFLVARSADHWVIIATIVSALLYSAIVWRVFILQTARNVENRIVHKADVTSQNDSEEFLSAAFRAAKISLGEKPNHNISQAAKRQFLRGRWWYMALAAWPLHSFRAMRRLEFIESWSHYFEERELGIVPTLKDGPTKYLIGFVLDYAVAEVPNAIYHLAMTREQVEKNILAKIPADTLRDNEQQVAGKSAKYIVPDLATITKMSPKKKFIPLEFSDFMKTFEGRLDVDKTLLIKLHKKSWLHVTGIVNGVPGVPQSALGITMYLTPLGGSPLKALDYPVHVTFDNRWGKRTALLVPESMITIIAQPSAISGRMLFLHHAEIVDADYSLV